MPVPSVGGAGNCRACGRRGVRRGNMPDDPKGVPPIALVCSIDCGMRWMSGELGPWGSFGWLKC